MTTQNNNDVQFLVEHVKTLLTNLLSSGDLGNHSGVCGYCSGNRSISDRRNVVYYWSLFASNAFLEVHRHLEGYSIGYVDYPREMGPRRRKFVRGLLLSLERRHPFSYVSVKFWEEFENIDKET